MGLFDKFKRKPTVEEMEAESEYLDTEGDLVDKRSRIAERKAAIKRLEKEYGPAWHKVLGVTKLVDMQTLRSLLGQMNSGLKGQGGPLYNPKLSTLPNKKLRTAGSVGFSGEMEEGGMRSSVEERRVDDRVAKG